MHKEKGSANLRGIKSSNFEQKKSVRGKGKNFSPFALNYLHMSCS